MAFWQWSTTTNSNGNSDGTINFLEGQTPGSLNDSARAMMARLREYGNDISGAIVTTGTSTAYAVSSNQGFDTLAHLDGQMIAFTPHVINGQTVTLSVDGLTASPLRPSPGVELQSNSLLAGTPYFARYSTADSAFYLHGAAGGSYGIPLGAGMDFWGSTTPSSAFAFPTGQAISRTTYASCFALFGTTYGSGDGTTTFNLPDKTGRVSAMKEASASRLTTTYFGSSSGKDGASLGNVGGGENTALLTANLPAYTPSGSIANGSITVTGGASGRAVSGDGNNNGGGGGSFSAMSSTPLSLVASQGTTVFSGNSQGGSSVPLRTVPPTIICNYILRIA